MALKATIFKATLDIADLDRGYYASHPLTLARHPSETDERMMVRLLAFARHADPELSFTKGLCADDEPALWQITPGGEIALWLEVGLPDEKRLRKACNRARRVVVYAYGGRAADLWWQQNREALARLSNLSVYSLSATDSQALAALAQRGMQLQCTLQEGRLWLGTTDSTLEIMPETWQESP